MDRSEIGRLAAGARDDLPGLRRFIRIELPRMDEKELRRRLVEEYERGAELEILEDQNERLRKDYGRAQDEVADLMEEVDELEGRLQDAGRCFSAVRSALQEFDGPVSEKLESLLMDPQDDEAQEELKDLAEQMQRKP